MNNYKGRRIAMSILGVLGAGIAVGFLKRAAMGVDPFQALMSGLDARIPITFGTLYVIVGAALLLFGFFADRHYIGLGTIVTMLFQGYVIDFSREVLFALLPNPGIAVRVICFAIGILLLCFSSSVYFTADLGVSAYDAVSLIVANTWKKGQFKYNRIISDFICVVIGSACYLWAGGTLKELPEIVGIGTIITAFFMGPLIDYFNKILLKNIL